MCSQVPLSKTVGVRIKRYRRERNLKQASLAYAIGMSPRHYQNIEAGSVDVKASTLESLACALKIPPRNLLDESGKNALEALGLHGGFEVLDALHVGVQVVTTLGMVCFLNKRRQQMLAMSPEDLRFPHYVWDFLEDPSEKPRLREYLNHHLKEMPEPTPYYTRNRAKNGVTFPIKADWNYLRGRDKKVVGFIMVIISHPSC